jgi:uncharacterized membrane protein YqaE (UPF0057 family)
MTFVRLLIAFILPPLAVYMQFGTSRRLALNILLTLLGFVPGMVHAVFIMASEPPGLVRRERFEQRQHGTAE